MFLLVRTTQPFHVFSYLVWIFDASCMLFKSRNSFSTFTLNTHHHYFPAFPWALASSRKIISTASDQSEFDRKLK